MSQPVDSALQDRWRPWREGVVPGLWITAHSLLMIAASPLFTMTGLWPVAFLSLIPLVVASLKLAPLSKRAIIVAYLGFTPWWFVTHFWLINVSLLGMLPLVFILSTFDAAAIAILARIARLNRPAALFLFPLVWTGSNYFRGEIAGNGYAWGWAVHPLIDAPFIAAPACIIGVYGLTFLLAAFAAAAVFAHSQTGPKKVIAPVGVALVWAVLGWFGSQIASTPPAPTPVRFSIIQTNVPQSNKIDWTIEQENRDFLRFRELTLDAVATSSPPDVVVWPETMAPGMTLAPQALKALNDSGIIITHLDGTKQWATSFADWMLDLSLAIRVPLIVGESYVDNLTIEETPDGKIKFKESARYNASFVLREGKIERQWYFKQHLTPFGEVMPYISNWPWLEEKLLTIGAKGMAFNLDEGKDLTVLTVPALDGRTIRCVTPICFESTDSPLNLRLLFANGERRADVIVNLTNDGWFTFSGITRRQHLQAARWRSLETLTPTVRAANTGISAFIRQDGSVQSSGVKGHPDAVDLDGILDAEVRLPTRVPPFAQIGNLPAKVCCILTGLMGLFLLGRRWLPKRVSRPD